MKKSLKEQDEYTWLLKTARKLHAIGMHEIAESLEEMGRNIRRELRSHMVVLNTHLLKWHHQPEKRNLSWEHSVLRSREAIREIFVDNPGMKNPQLLSQLHKRAYSSARSWAARETGLPYSSFSKDAPWSHEESMTRRLR